MTNPTPALPPHRSPKPALKAVGRHTVRSPLYLFRITARIPRGLRVITAPIRRWSRDEANEQNYLNALAAKPGEYKSLRADRDELIAKRRSRIFLAIALVLIAASTAQWFGYGWAWQYAAGGILVLALVVGGRPVTQSVTQSVTRNEPDERKSTAVSVADVRAALADAGVIKDGQELRTIAMPRVVGRGVEGVAQLPPGISVMQCVGRKEQIASSLGVDSAYLQLSKAAHDGQLRFWVPDGDPFKNNMRRLPLLDVDRFNSWQPAPFGFTMQGNEVVMRLMYSNLLVGSKPGAGKTFTARCALAPYVLDPAAKIYVANGKFDGAWAAVAPFAARYIRGRSDDDAFAVDDMLATVQEEMDRRFRDHMGDASKVTESMGLAPIVVVVDELQNYTTNSTPTDLPLRGKKATLGQWIDHRLVDIVKNGRAAGVILILITQKPSEESLSTELRSQVGTRFALKTMDYYTSNMILGQLSKQGVDASNIDPRHKGVGIYIADLEDGIVDDDLGPYPMVRTFLCDDEEWAVMCRKGLALREAAGQLEPTVEIPVAPVLQLVQSKAEPAIVELVRSVWPEGRDRASCAELAAALGWADGSEVTRRLRVEAGVAATSVRIGGSTPKGLYLADLDRVGETV